MYVYVVLCVPLSPPPPLLSIDAHVGLLTNAEVHALLKNNDKNNYPPYSVYQEAVIDTSKFQYLPSSNCVTTAPTSSSLPLQSYSPLPQPLEKSYIQALEPTIWLKQQVLGYLDTHTSASVCTPSIVHHFLDELRVLMQTHQVYLTPCEQMQLVNLRPTRLVEIHRCIEECEERLSEEQTLLLLNLIERILPAPPAKAEAEGENQEEAMEEAEQ